jgi:hypothetical protein
MEIRLKSKTLYSPYLDEDCNYELNLYNVIDSLSYIEWGLPDLRILNKYNIIKWDIYSARDLSLDHIDIFYEYIHMPTYLNFIESQFSQITKQQIDNIELLCSYTSSYNIVKKHAQANKKFYFVEDFLIIFKECVDLHTDLNYLNNEKLILNYVNILPLSSFESVITNIKIENTLLIDKIIARYNNYRFEQYHIYRLIFKHQIIPYSYIIQNYKKWSYDIWLCIILYQKFTETQLLELLDLISILRYMISFHYNLSEDFIIKYHKKLDMNTVSEFQALSWKFIKENSAILNTVRLLKNKKIIIPI